MLKAQGHSYHEIGESLGWTYTKVNRCITEGRARFLKVYAEIEAGAECERFAPTLAALVAGTASADALLELRPHIRNCSSCRATMRQLHATRLGRLGAIWPIPALLAPLRWVSAWFREPADASPGSDDAPVDPAAIPDVHEALRGLELPEPRTGDGAQRLLELKAHVCHWWHRLLGSDVATTAQLASSAGGAGRIATLGAIVGLCLSGLGAGTVCVVTGVIESPFLRGPEERPSIVRRAPTPKPRPAPRRLAQPIIVAPAPTATRAPQQAAVTHPPKRRPARRTTTPRDHEQAPAIPAPTGATKDFAFEQAAPATQPVPAQAPANGGGEFAP
jgi:hypothetical protein